MRPEPRRGRQLLTSRRAAVLGSPVGHSLSPVLHEAGYAAAGLPDWSYGRHECEEGGLAPFVAGLDETWRGLSLTMPLKVVALDVADDVSDLAREAGGVNTLVRTESGWTGDNTDVHGIVAALREATGERRPGPGRATVIGAGATARSALLALRTLGAGEVRVAARRLDRAAALGDTPGVEVVPVPLETWARAPGGLVVSTVPADAGSAVAAALDRPDEDLLRATTLLDVVYAGWPTPLARAAAARGATVVSGLEMLLHQAAEQFALFTGVPAPLGAMRAAGRAALHGGAPADT